MTQASGGQPAHVPGLSGPGWVKTGPAAIRLIAEKDGVDGASAVSLGVQIRLVNGWWTYWRAPGEAGMPPDFDWTGSQNLKGTPELYWPRPLQKTVFGQALRVYRDEVVFPLRVAPTDPAQPLRVRLNLTFGVCKEVCIPVRANLDLDLPPRPAGTAQTVPLYRDLIARYQAEVPSANQQLSGLRIQNVRILSGGLRPALSVDILRSDPRAAPLVVIEASPGEPPMVAKSLGRPQLGQPWSFAADLDVDRDQAKSWTGRRIRVTILDGRRSLEQIWVVGANADRSGKFGVKQPGGQSGDPLAPPEDAWKPKD